jgi:hypothetical protein
LLGPPCALGGGDPRAAGRAYFSAFTRAQLRTGGRNSATATSHNFTRAAPMIWKLAN